MRRAVVALVIGAVVAGACQGEIDTGDAEKKIKGSLETLYPKTTVGDLECPSPKGDVLTCDTTIQGTPVKASVMFDDDGNYDTVTLDKAVIDTQTARTTLAGQIMQRTNETGVTLDCGPQAYLIANPGDVIDCAVSGSSQGKRIEITVKDVKGSVTWDLVA
jgi:hypothetical protein